MKIGNNYFILFQNCIPTKGISRSIIADYQRGTHYFIPNGLYDLIGDFRLLTTNQIVEKYFDQGLTQEMFLEYLEYLEENELGHYTDTPDSFPLIEEVFETPSLIHDAIIEWSDYHKSHLSQLIKQINDVGCKFLEIRSFSGGYTSDFEEFVKLMRSTKIRGVVIYCNYIDNDLQDLENLVHEFQIITNLFLHSCNVDPITISAKPEIVITKTVLTNNNCCGYLGKEFNVNLPHYLESRNFNPCLNKKFSIDEKGMIKNCPSISANSMQTYIERSIIDQIKDASFQQIWKTTKDQIDVCMHCEFRYICGDCRSGVGISQKPRHCKYNPLIMSYEN